MTGEDKGGRAYTNTTVLLTNPSHKSTFHYLTDVPFDDTKEEITKGLLLERNLYDIHRLRESFKT